MPGRFVYGMNVSVDLRIENATGEQGGGAWMRIGESLHREFNARARAMTLLVEGRTIYETMEAFWPNARHDASLPDYLREFGEIWTSTPTARAETRSTTPRSSPTTRSSSTCSSRGRSTKA